MRRVMASVLAVVLASTGCAGEVGRASLGVQLPMGEAADRLRDWDVLRRQPSGAHLLVALDTGRLVDARLDSAGDDGLTVLRGGMAERLPRNQVVRVIRVESMSAVHAKQGASAGLLLGGLITISVGLGLWFTLLTDPAIFAGFGALTGIGEHRQILVYERQ
jgi:hypothetical protein